MSLIKAPFGFASTAAETGTIDRRSDTLHGVARYALDPDNAKRLWVLSESLLAAAA